jgi:hypothetical protein
MAKWNDLAEGLPRLNLTPDSILGSPFPAFRFAPCRAKWAAGTARPARVARGVLSHTTESRVVAGILSFRDARSAQPRGWALRRHTQCNAARNFRFGLEPVFNCVPVEAPALLVELVSAFADFLLRVVD